MNAKATFCAFVLGCGILVAVNGYVDMQVCEAKGGKRMRAVFETFKCYDRSKLEVVK